MADLRRVRLQEQSSFLEPVEVEEPFRPGAGLEIFREKDSPRGLKGPERVRIGQRLLRHVLAARDPGLGNPQHG